MISRTFKRDIKISVFNLKSVVALLLGILIDGCRANNN
jgi:hypothetical protein